MPGVHIAYDLNGNLAQDEPLLLESMESLLHYSWYSGDVAVSNGTCFLGYTKHEKYPLSVSEDDTYIVCVEGMVYGKTASSAAGEIKDLSKSFFSREDGFLDRISQWQLSTDGDFLVFVLHKGTGDMVIINNALGRLPLYYCAHGERLYASREIRFIANLARELRLDRMGIAQYLLFAYPLGERTIFENISRQPPASLVTASRVRSEIKVERTCRFNFAAKDILKSDRGEQASILIDRYMQGCLYRYDPDGSNVVGLSGGLDSRVVAAALKKIGVSFSNATFVDNLRYFDPDVDIARRIAEVLDLEWKLFSMEASKGRDALKLLKMKSGINFLGMSFSVPLFESMRGYYGDRITLFTGDGGDRLLPDLRPMLPLRTVDDLAEYIIDYYTFVPLDIVSAVTRINRGEIISEFKERLIDLDERDMKMKYVNFMILERNFKWSFEGEDRNRYFCWPVAPFYTIDFFTHALSCPDEIKERQRFYREFLVQLSPSAAMIDNAKWHFPITSRRLGCYYLARRAFYALPSSVRKIILSRRRKRVNPYSADSNIMNCFTDQLESCSAVSDYLSVEEIRKNVHAINKFSFDYIFTITSAIEEFFGETNTLERYSDVDLM